MQEHRVKAQLMMKMIILQLLLDNDNDDDANDKLDDAIGIKTTLTKFSSKTVRRKTKYNVPVEVLLHGFRALSPTLV